MVATTASRPSALLDYGGKLLPLSASALQQSAILASLETRSEGGRKLLKLDSAQLASLQRLCGHALTPLNVERFLTCLAGPSTLCFCSEVEQVIQILKLADWFDAHELRSRCDERLCQLLQGLSNRQAVSDSREEAASQALEAGVQHCLTKTVGWLLPWALQQLSRGNKAAVRGAAQAEQLSGELRSAQGSAWWQDRTAARRRRLHACLMADDQLKVLLMEQQWWAQRADAACCADCGASPADVRPAYDVTGEAWLFSRDGSGYRAAAAHFAHLLHERCWGLTPAGSGFDRLAPLPQHHHSPRGEAALSGGQGGAGGHHHQAAAWQACLAQTCSVSSVGQRGHGV